MVTTVVRIDGMMCPKCEKHMDEAVKEAFDVKKVKSSHKEAKCEILSKEPLDEELLKKVVEDTGYTFVEVIK